MRIRRAAALAGCALVGGCGTLIDPYVKVDDVHIADPSGIDANPGWKRSQDLLHAEHASAQKQADAYRGGAKDQVQFKTALAASLPILNAAALGFAANHDRSDFASVVGYGTAAALGVGGLLTSPARSAIYLQGQTATLCAMAAYDVYFISQSDYDTYLVNDPEGLGKAILEVARKRDDLTIALAQYDAKMQTLAAEADAKEAKDKAAAAAAAARRVRLAKAAAAKAAAKVEAERAAAAKPGTPATGAPTPPAAAQGARPAPKGAPSATTHAAPAAATAPAAPPAAPKTTPATPPAPAAKPPATPPKAAAPKADAGAAPTAGQKFRTAAANVDRFANAVLDRASGSLTADAATLTSLQGVRERVDEAGRSLGDRRMAIKAEVDQNIQTTELTIDQIKAAISASALASSQPSAAPPKAADTTTTKGEGSEDPSVREELKKDLARDVNDKIDALTKALAKLEDLKTKDDGWLQRELQKEHDATQVGSCTASAKVVLTATPDNPAQVTKDKSLKIQIHAPTTGGAPSFSKVEDGLTATMTTGGGYEYTLTIAEASSPKPATKDQSVVVSSGSQSVKVDFTVTDATGGGGGGGGGGDTPDKGATNSGATPQPTDKAPPKAPGAADDKSKPSGG
jgi:hypothetical protein